MRTPPLLPVQVLLPQLHQLVLEAQGTPAPKHPPATTSTSSSAAGAQAAKGAAGTAEGAGPLTGAALLRALHARSRCGVPLLQACMQRLLWHCNQVLYKQLSSW